MDTHEYREDQDDAANVAVDPSIEMATPNQSEIAEKEERPSVFPVRYAGFWMRFWAYLLDLIVVGSLNRLLIKPVFRLLDIPVAEFHLFAPITIVTAIVFYLYFVLMTKYFGQTLGKMVFGLKVVNLDGNNSPLTWGTVLFREWIGRFISSTVLIGYLIVAFLPKKQGLHDLFTDTTVVHAE